MKQWILFAGRYVVWDKYVKNKYLSIRGNHMLGNIGSVAKYPSALVLIFVNLIPLYGVLFMEWSGMQVLLAYWAESAIIGFFTILKMLMAKARLSLILFFMLQVVLFILGYLFFIVCVLPRFVPGMGMDVNILTTLGYDVPKIVGLILSVFGDNIGDWIFFVLMLAMSHGVSFLSNYIGRKEYLNMGELYNRLIVLGPKYWSRHPVMAALYNRLITMHFAIIFGVVMNAMFFVKFAGTPLLIMVAFKIWFDVGCHLNERENAAKNLIQPSFP